MDIAIKINIIKMWNEFIRKGNIVLNLFKKMEENIVKEIIPM